MRHETAVTARVGDGRRAVFPCYHIQHVPCTLQRPTHLWVYRQCSHDHGGILLSRIRHPPRAARQGRRQRRRRRAEIAGRPATECIDCRHSRTSFCDLETSQKLTRCMAWRGPVFLAARCPSPSAPRADLPLLMTCCARGRVGLCLQVRSLSVRPVQVCCSQQHQGQCLGNVMMRMGDAAKARRAPRRHSSEDSAPFRSSLISNHSCRARASIDNSPSPVRHPCTAR